MAAYCILSTPPSFNFFVYFFSLFCICFAFILILFCIFLFFIFIFQSGGSSCMLDQSGGDILKFIDNDVMIG